ncbi:hypothetical protein INH39_22435 [Massilia violaceinigra]|uniref:Lipoprotein n=1 Tax=Massilia violaceinigra TaxID=2045208 RepID=A0ABY4A0C7_9BURK|nr:hypothetical protein [Massilia violaceinigra]UOD28203.1 hypothetical protein INH39_22435 [Massilia violaceinigra]
MTHRLLSFSLLACALLAACGKSPDAASPAPGADAPAASAGSGQGASWEVVLLQREEPPNQALKMMHDAAYLSCVEFAKLSNMPVKPFPVAPADYMDERETWIGNGSSTVVITERLGGEEGGEMVPENGCAYSLRTRKEVLVQIRHGGKTTSIVNGKVKDTTDLPPKSPYASKPDTSTPRHTEPRTVNKVELRCLPKSAGVLNTNQPLDLREECVYKTDNVLLDTMGRPLIVLSHAHMDIVNPKYAMTTIREPLSLRRLDKSEKEIYQVSNWAK